MIPSLLRASSIALMVSSAVALGACAASSRQRPVGMGDVSTGAESLAATRKQLEGTWTLTRFEVADNTGQLITVRAKAQLTYDAYGNLSIRGVLEEPLPGQKTVTESPALAYTGKAVIDTARKEMVLTGTSATVEPDPSLLAKIGPEIAPPLRVRRGHADDFGAERQRRGHVTSDVPKVTVMIRALLLALVVAVACSWPADAQTPAAPRPRVGVALGGGSARGIAHVGVLRWLEEHRVPIDVIAGTSMGGLIGGSYATGMTPDEIEAMLGGIDWDAMFGSSRFEFSNVRRKRDLRAYPSRLEFGLKRGIVPPPSLNNGQQVDLLLSRIAAPYYGIKSFDELPTPFRCVAVDLKTRPARRHERRIARRARCARRCRCRSSFLPSTPATSCWSTAAR